MNTYIILTTFSPDSCNEPSALRETAKTVARDIKRDCPGLNWKESYASLGKYDVIDVVEADDPVEVQKAAMTIRRRAKACTETFQGTPWNEFLSRL